MILHGSYSNSSDRSRRAVILNSMGPNTVSNIANYERMDLLKDFPSMGEHGQVLDNKCFPLLFNADKELGALKKEVFTI